MSTIVRNNSAVLLMGDSGSGKSSLIITAAKWIWEKYKKKTLYYVADGGGWPSEMNTLIQAGIVWPWKMRTRGECFETCQRATKGWFPLKRNPVTGDTAPNCKLVKPIHQEFTLFCPAGHEIRKSPSRSFVGSVQCPICKTHTTLHNGSIKEELTVTPGFENVGAVAFDGLTSMQRWAMEDLSERAARGELVGESTALGGKIISGEVAVGLNNRSHYGLAQTVAEKWILNSVAIPFLVAPPIWTALENRGQDTQTKLPIYGPEIAGSAKTSAVPSWVGDCLGTQVIEEGKVKKWRLNLTEYREADNIPHLCKTRAKPGTMPDYLEDTPDEDGKIQFFKNFNLGHYFDLLQKSMEDSITAFKKGNKDLPGLPSGELSSSTTEEKPKPTSPVKKPGINKVGVRR